MKGNDFFTPIIDANLAIHLFQMPTPIHIQRPIKFAFNYTRPFTITRVIKFNNGSQSLDSAIKISYIKEASFVKFARWSPIHTCTHWPFSFPSLPYKIRPAMTISHMLQRRNRGLSPLSSLAQNSQLQDPQPWKQATATVSIYPSKARKISF